VTHARRLRTSLAAAALAASLSARADDELPKDDKPTLEGDVRVGWRVISGEGRGRFPQDHALKDGGRLFDLNLRASDPREGATLDEIEARVSGVGDPWTDALLALRRRGLFEVEGGWRRDESNYRASGDPFPYDLTRERTFVHGRWTPSRDLAVRLSWDRNERRGDAYTAGYDFFTALAVPQRRTIASDSDRFTAGADWGVGIFRFALSQTVGTAHVDDSRFSRSADAADLSHDTTRRSTSSRTWATTGKVAATLVEDVLDVTLLATRSRTPLEETTTGSVSGPGGPTSPWDGEGEIVRKATHWRFETSWRPRSSWEIVFAGESDDVVDEESGFFLLGGSPASAPHARVTDRTQRWSADATWEATEKLRLRLGEQYLREEVFVPTDSPFAIFREPYTGHRPTDLESTSWRTTGGADWTPLERLSLSALARITTNDEPHTTPVAELAQEYSLRARWKPSDEWALSAVAKRQGLVNTSAVLRNELNERPSVALGRRTDLDSAGRTTVLSQDAAWTHGPWAVRGSLTYRRFSTDTDTAWGGRMGSLHLTNVSFESRNVTAALDVRHELTKTLRVFADVSRTNATGDFAAHWTNASLGGEYDLRKDLTLGLRLSSWRLRDGEVRADGYRAYGVETSVTWRF
jgi:hypothetical protein